MFPISGFVSVGPANLGTDGKIVTKPFRAPAGELWLNVDVTQRCDPSHCGNTTLSIAAVLADGTRVHSTAVVASASVPATGIIKSMPNSTALGDHIALKVRWQGTPPTLEGAMLHLEFRLHGARLYSWWFAPGKPAMKADDEAGLDTASPVAVLAGLFNGAVFSKSYPQVALSLANVTALSAGCEPLTQLTDRQGRFKLSCPAGRGATRISVWCREYLPLSDHAVSTGVSAAVALASRPIPGFPAVAWRFEGWATQAQTEPVPGTDISFLAHPSVVRTRNQARMLWDELEPGAAAEKRRLLMLASSTGQWDSCGNYTVGRGFPLSFILKNHNLDHPSNPLEWVAAAGTERGRIQLAAVPTSPNQHETQTHGLYFRIVKKYWGAMCLTRSSQ
jgi:hypothetical protein